MADTTGELNSLYKVNYADGVENLLPPTGKLTKAIKFKKSPLNGKHYEAPVILTAESGFTYSGDTQTAYALNDTIGMNMASAIVPGYDILLASTVGYQQAARASKSSAAFKTVLSTKFENMLFSTEKREEINILYGQDCLASAAQQTVATVNPLPIVIDTASWATGIWAGSENSLVVFSRSSSAATVDSLLPFRVARVDVEARTVYFAAVGSSSLANLEAAVEAYAVKLHFYSTVTDNSGTIAYQEAAGLKKQMTNTSELFGINAATYDLWRGNTFATSGQLTLGKINAAVSLAVQRGLNVDASVWINPDTWADMSTDAAAQRMYDSSYSKSKSTNGSQVLEFVSQNGTLKVIPYNLVKEGDAFIFPESKVIRIGARELSLTDPVRGNGEVFFTLPGNAGVGLRAYSNQAVFIEAPAQCVYVSGIVNS